MFIKKHRDALKSMFKTTSSKDRHNKDPTPSNLSSIRDPITGLITNNPARITARIESLETKSLSPDSRVNPLANFPWLHAIPAGVPPTKKHDNRPHPMSSKRPFTNFLTTKPPARTISRASYSSTCPTHFTKRCINYSKP
jgi:hypothetical protein